MADIMSISDDLYRRGYRLHHGAYARGYVSRKPNAPVRVDPYKGRFGEGFIVHLPCYDSTQYHRITYYIKED